MVVEGGAEAEEEEGGKCDGSDANIKTSKTRQSFPPLYESDNSSGLQRHGFHSALAAIAPQTDMKVP